MVEKEFRVNNYITLKLENNKTNIYINNNLFQQCKSLVFKIDEQNSESHYDINSIDEAIEKGMGSTEIEIPPETSFKML